MSAGDSLHRSASALRTALVGHPVTRFDAPQLFGPSPTAGRVVEGIELHGRRLTFEWDDGIVFITELRKSGSWDVYRDGGVWRRSFTEMSAVIEVDGWVAVCFEASDLETYRRLDQRRHPGMGRPAPDLRDPKSDLGGIVNLMLSYPEPDARLADVLLDQRVMNGLGNVQRSEVLWAAALSPYAPVGKLSEHDAIRVVDRAAVLLRSSRWSEYGSATDPLQVYARTGQGCSRCAGTVEGRRMGPQRRMLYWCPGCQVRLDPQLTRSSDDTPMDPHPAAQRWIADLPWNRTAG